VRGDKGSWYGDFTSHDYKLVLFKWVTRMNYRDEKESFLREREDGFLCGGTSYVRYNVTDEEKGGMYVESAVRGIKFECPKKGLTGNFSLKEETGALKIIDETLIRKL